MDVTQNMIIIRGEFKTTSIDECCLDEPPTYYKIKFINAPKVYKYRKENVIWLKNPIKLDIENYKLVKASSLTEIPPDSINGVWEFHTDNRKYWHVLTDNSHHEEFDDKSLIVVKSALSDPHARSIFDYLKEASVFTDLVDENGINLLKNQYDHINFIGDDTVLSSYINPHKQQIKKYNPNRIIIYPFGCNKSQQEAVSKAFSNQLSIIQGPPGTGKTQTILNIIANILLEKDKTVLVVSNNNAAISDIYEKLENNGLGFFVALLGNTGNKTNFINGQDKKVIPSDIASWKAEEPINTEEFHQIAESVKNVFSIQERLAIINEELAQLRIESQHFKKKHASKSEESLHIRNRVHSKSILNLYNRIEKYLDKSHNGFIDRFKWVLYTIWTWGKFGIKQSNLMTCNMQATMQALLEKYYSIREEELISEKNELVSKLNSNTGKAQLTKFIADSKIFLRHQLYNKYGNNHTRPIFSEDDFWRRGNAIAKEYPIILSTTFSARNSLKNVIYDYVIMDEASQVAIETGALALSIGKNAVIVGDSMQLPNVQTRNTAVALQILFEKFNIQSEYDSSKFSFLESIKHIINGCPSTLLREHYRCHPRIINFCNQKFYDGNLIIMTDSQEETSPLTVYRTVPGNHARGHQNEREAQVICQEVMPNICLNDTGIIAAYNDQVNLLKDMISQQVEISTVHKFQGREKDTIVIDFVDNQPTSFSDNPNLLNVAISRAKKHLCLVVTGNNITTDSNVADLMDYINYNNGETHESHISSIFDILYTNQNNELIDFLNKHQKISEYASENITYGVIKDIINDAKYRHLAVLFSYPMDKLIINFDSLTSEEREFANNPLTHIDFIVYNKVSKKVVLAIETDGHAFHKGRNSEAQASRDKLKDSILNKYHIPLLRLGTTGSNERQRIIEKLA